MRSDRYLDWQNAGNGQGVYGAVFSVMFLSWMHVPTLVLIVGAIVGFAIGKVIGMTLLGGAGRVAQTIYAPAAAGSYAPTHSHIDAMEAKGDFKGAAAAWEAVAVSTPSDAWPLIRAGELYLRELGDTGMALDRFRHARDLPGIKPEQHRYISQKLIDLYLGPLADEGRALVELRRLIDAHPGTREAEGARAAIARIKQQRAP
ncbi:MAG TPA: hypothetical protein VJL28_02965 [Gemmatimonadaceae bacterium]|nr:hypothetical protein [Gemmatimonadaceae bacterium]